MTSSVIANSDNTRKVYDIKVLRLCSKIESIPFFEWDEAVHKKPYKCTWNECKSIRTCAMITFMKCRKCRIYFRLNLTNPAFTETATSMVREGCLNLVVIQFAWPPPDSVCCHYPPPYLHLPGHVQWLLLIHYPGLIFCLQVCRILFCFLSKALLVRSISTN